MTAWAPPHRLWRGRRSGGPLAVTVYRPGRPPARLLAELRWFAESWNHGRNRMFRLRLYLAVVR